ncbi:MAG: hypothetical protein ACREBU_14880 [Nitrososphaera sp.]
MSSQAVSSGLQIEVSLNSVFASRRRNTEDEKQIQPTMLPSNFQVYTKIDEESRKDNKLVISFLLTLNDTKGLVTYEFRGICTVHGNSADFESVMETSKNSRVPKILDILYQKLYPAMFILSGMTTSSYPQSVALLTDMVSTEPIQVRQEVVAVAEGGQESKVDSAPPSTNREPKVSPMKLTTPPRSFAAAKTAKARVASAEHKPATPQAAKSEAE